MRSRTRSASHASGSTFSPLGASSKALITCASGPRYCSGTSPVQLTSEYPAAARAADARSSATFPASILARYCTRLTSTSPGVAPAAAANASPADPVTTCPLSTDRPFAAARAASWRSRARP